MRERLTNGSPLSASPAQGLRQERMSNDFEKARRWGIALALSFWISVILVAAVIPPASDWRMVIGLLLIASYLGLLAATYLMDRLSAGVLGILPRSWLVLLLVCPFAALPVFLGGLRIGATLSVIGAVVGELVGADKGLGFLVNVGRGQYDTALVFVAIFALVGLALILYGAVSAAERRLLRWQNLKID